LQTLHANINDRSYFMLGLVSNCLQVGKTIRVCSQSTQVNSAFYPVWDGKTSFSLLSE